MVAACRGTAPAHCPAHGARSDTAIRQHSDQLLSDCDHRLTEEEHEVTLNAEQPVVNTETIPVERVRLGTETVTGEQEVNAQVRKEQIDTETAPADQGSRTP